MTKAHLNEDQPERQGCPYRPPTDALPQLPFPRADILDIPPDNRRVRTSDGITRVLTRAGDPAWLVTSYDQALELFADDRLGRTHRDPGSAPQISSSVIFGCPQGDYALERETHQRLRKLLVPHFSARRIGRLAEYAEEQVSGILTKMATMTPPVDICRVLSYPLPVMVISKAVGVPYEENSKFIQLANTIDNLGDPEGARAAHLGLAEYFAGVIEERRQQTDTDDSLISRMVTDEGSYWTTERLAAIATNVFFGGYQTTVARISQGILLLLSNPEQRAALQADPSLADPAVEEIIRMSSPANHGFPRWARADIQVGSTLIREGDAVLLFPDVVNRDERAFQDPDDFNISRSGGNMHLGFGHGAHYCVGASLARLELQAVFRLLFRRFPGLRLAVPYADLKLNESCAAGGLTELPVSW